MAKEDYKGIWVFAEQQNGVLNPAVLEILAKALELKAHTGEDLNAVLLGDGVSALADTLFFNNKRASINWIMEHCIS